MVVGKIKKDEKMKKCDGMVCDLIHPVGLCINKLGFTHQEVANEEGHNGK